MPPHMPFTLIPSQVVHSAILWSAGLAQTQGRGAASCESVEGVLRCAALQQSRWTPVALSAILKVGACVVSVTVGLTIVSLVVFMSLGGYAGHLSANASAPTLLSAIPRPCDRGSTLAVMRQGLPTATPSLSRTLPTSPFGMGGCETVGRCVHSGTSAARNQILFIVGSAFVSAPGTSPLPMRSFRAGHPDRRHLPPLASFVMKSNGACKPWVSRG